MADSDVPQRSAPGASSAGKLQPPKTNVPHQGACVPRMLTDEQWDNVVEGFRELVELGLLEPPPDEERRREP